jgi:16S rRNA (cytidine1402-2'-O)-methyltransferase
LSQAIDYFSAPRGEFTLVVAGRQEAAPAASVNTEQALSRLKEAGMTAKEAILKLSDETGISRKELYKTWIKNNKG